MNIRIARPALVALVLVLSSSAPARADHILQPVGASTNMGSPGLPPTVTIDQSGLSTGYTSLVTDFDVYIGTNPSHTLAGSSTWISGFPPTGNFDFDLGGSFTIQSFALWNFGQNDPGNIIGFTLLADDNAAFGSPTLLGNFTADPNTGTVLAVLPEVFGFTPTEASFVRMQITSNNGGLLTGFGEAAFEVQSSAVPEPSSLTLAALAGVAGLVAAARKRRKLIAPSA